MPRPRRKTPLSALLRALALPVKALVGLVLLADEALRPIYRPIVTRIFAHPFFALLERRVAALPRAAILIAFAVPFLIAEPLKLVAVVLLAKGQALAGIVTFALAQLATFILVERIYHAGRAKLLTYGWFAWAAARIASIRDRAIAFARRMARRLKAFVRLHA